MNEEKNTDKKADLANLMRETYTTRRATIQGIENILYNPIPILDHGFVRVIDYMGDDSAIVQAARVSYGKGTKQTNQDRGLIHYLMRHKHTTPFEMCDIKFHIKLPIFVARQWIRHRTASVNEYSGRYSIMSNEFYLPSKTNLAPQSQINKQGREDIAVPDAVADKVLSILKEDATQCYSHYIEMMNEDDAGNILHQNTVGISRELARMNLTLNYYTEWYWKTNLHNLFHFLALRADPHAQYEIRVYADAILQIVKEWVPFAYEAFEEYRIHSASFSRSGLKALKRMLSGEKVTEENSNMTKREWKEFIAILEN
jgi:thymidylate synthase (FAD)